MFYCKTPLKFCILLYMSAALLGILVMVPYGMLAAKKSAQNKNSEDAGQIPFGPFLAIAAPIIYLWGSALVDIYFKYVLE